MGTDSSKPGAVEGAGHNGLTVPCSPVGLGAPRQGPAPPSPGPMHAYTPRLPASAPLLSSGTATFSPPPAVVWSKSCECQRPGPSRRGRDQSHGKGTRWVAGHGSISFPGPRAPRELQPRGSWCGAVSWRSRAPSCPWDVAPSPLAPTPSPVHPNRCCSVLRLKRHLSSSRLQPGTVLYTTVLAPSIPRSCVSTGFCKRIVVAY